MNDWQHLADNILCADFGGCSPFTGRGGEAPEREIESRIPLSYRWFMFVVVIIPKVIIGISLLFFGGKLVLRSENNPEVIMNSLAAYFVAGASELQHMLPACLPACLPWFFTAANK